MRKQICVFAILLTMVFGVFSSATKIFPVVKATYVEEPITEDTVWTLVDSPFVVSNDIMVYPSVTLTIEPGVEVKFGGAFSLAISGQLFADGTSKPITFTSNKIEPQEGDWYAVIFNGIQRSTLINCIVKYATNGILVENGDVEVRNSLVTFSENGIVAINGELSVQNTTVSQCSQNGIVANSSETTVQNCIIMQNGENGIYVNGDGPTTIELNTLMANGNGILITGSTTSNVYVNQNIISVNDENGIQIDAENHSNINIVYNSISSNTKGLYISSPTSTHLTSNAISYNSIGILYDDGSHTVNYNDIYANELGMDVELNATVDAENNYWGDKSGPYHEKLNPNGQGNPVGGDGINLDFIFFLAKSSGIINTRPTAVLLADRILIPPNGDVVFFATESFDPDGRVDRYIFNFGDGYGSGLTTLSVFTHKYPLTGTYYANLTVIDDYGTASIVVFGTINVQNLPAPQVSVNLSNSTIHEGEQASITVHVTEGMTPVENATVTMLSVIGGNFSQSSGLSNATGYFVTTFTAPDIAEKTYIRIVARASKTGYTNGVAHEYLEVSPFLSVQIDANPNTVKSEGTSQILVYVRSNDEQVANASVTVSSSLGSLSAETGVTDSSGAFSVVFTAPQTTTSLDAIITAEATKGGYMNGATQVTIVIEPKVLNVQVGTQPNATISEAEVNVTVHVDYEMIPIQDANVAVTADGGNFSMANGSTDGYGTVKFVYTTPPVSTRSMIRITVSVSKTGYAASQSQTELMVDPRTFVVTISSPIVESQESANIIVQVSCKEDTNPVIGANVTMSADDGSFNFTTQSSDASGTCNFLFTAPYTAAQIYVAITANVTKSGYVNGGNQTQITVTPKMIPEAEGGWPLMTILLILVPIIIVVIVVVVVLIKRKVITVSSDEMEEEA